MALRYSHLTRFVTIAILAVSVAPMRPLYAQVASAPAAALTLGDAIERACAVAPGIRGAEASVAAANATVESSGLLPNPTVSVEAENVLGTGRYARFGASEMTYSVSMPLELGGKRAARTRVAQADQANALVGVSIARADLTLRVTQAFITVVASERRARAAAERRELAGQAERVARLRVGAGKVSPIDEQRATAQRIGATVAAERAERAAKVAQANLARLIGATPPLAAVAPWFDDTGAAGEANGAGTSLSLAAADAHVAAASARVDAARRARIPDLTVSAGARRLNETNDHAAVLALSIPLPIFNRGNADVARARAELDKAEADRSAVELELAETLASAQAEVDNARASAVAANGPELAAAREAARIARIGYAEGKFSQLDLIEAERSLSQTQEAAIDALAAFHGARAQLARLLGRLDPIYKD
ncbi:outer membrane protein, cobalt-zinc-cadmium efflux system [Massilia sp. PDC64]|nr:TolC family protein [Massilia sp. PDC64]SDE64950.1 outer membrane protein, cobalt-zinc-cadmium efflux system [Massilia sp. PDC64]